MARMIPPVPVQKAPPGEQLVFERLRDDPGANDWTVLHSLNLARHVRQVEGEADFVVIAPNLGVLCVEVKSHQTVRRDADGMWHLGASPRRNAARSGRRMSRCTASGPSCPVPGWTSATCPSHQPSGSRERARTSSRTRWNGSPGSCSIVATSACRSRRSSPPCSAVPASTSHRGTALSTGLSSNRQVRSAARSPRG
ncbi:NERD domain-containing protein [Actinomadura sp. 7K507]|nr:NERD domain-containing protein [Actinomadura sp. 7K507]